MFLLILHRSLRWLAPVLFVVLLAGCTAEEALQQLSAEHRFRLGKSYFQDEDYLEAIEEFKVVSLQFGGTQWADDAQFYMAEARFARGEYILAAYEYDVLLRTMPASEYIRQARFRKATSYYESSPSSTLDQEFTRKAIEEYQTFLEYHATDTLASAADSRIRGLTAKLAQKEFDSGIIYLKMSYNKAATYYFDLVLEKYHDTPFAEPAHIRKAEALINRKRFDEAETVLARFLQRYPSSELCPEADQLSRDARDGKAKKIQDTDSTRQGASSHGS
ncbi:MAG: outer membrane protein assembly factor BamD [Bacteroidota bacterium]